MKRVLFVCLGNICRSPTAEGVFRHLVREAGLEREIEIDSAGTGDWHIGEGPDRRSTAAAKRRKYELGGASRQVTREDFTTFDLIVAMDRSNVQNLKSFAPDEDAMKKVVLLRSFDERADHDDVPDPYYGEGDGFERVLDICEAGCRGLLAHLRK